MSESRKGTIRYTEEREESVSLLSRNFVTLKFQSFRGKFRRIAEFVSGVR